MRSALIALCLTLTTSAAVACPLPAKGESRSCGKLAKDKYITGTVYIRSVHAPPPDFDQAKTTKFLTAARWIPAAIDLDRWDYAIADRKAKDVKGKPALRFVDATTITTSPQSTKRVQIVLVRSVDDKNGDTIVDVDGEDYALVPCRRGKRVSACLVAPSETRAAWKKRMMETANVTNRL